MPGEDNALERESQLIEAGKREAAELCEPSTATKPACDAVDGFEIIDEIGRGGMGVVYRAFQESTKRIVALKVMLAGQFASQPARERFQREVELAARFQHPGIVRVLESGFTSSGLPYYSMDYVDGAPLDHWLAVSQPDVKTTLRLFQKICEAVEQAHRRGIVHRDLKPANVLVDVDSKPWVLDFGLSKAVDAAGAGMRQGPTISEPGQVVGTLQYLSPEQAAGTSDKINAQTDVYALGVMLYEAVTGELPYDTAGSPSDVMLRIRQELPARPSSLSKAVDRSIETILLKALEKENHRRYASAGALGNDIARYLAGEPILARRSSRLYRLRTRIARNRAWVAAGIVAVTLSILALVAGLALRERQAREFRERELAAGAELVPRIQFTLERGEVKDALRAAEREFAQHAELPETRLLLAQALAKAGQQRPEADFMRQGAALLTEGTDGDPWRWVFDLLRAEICELTGHLEEAEELRAGAMSRATDDADAWYLRSYATFQTSEALLFANEAVQRAPTCIPICERVAFLSFLLGDLEGALTAADRLIRLRPDVAEWRLLRANVIARLNRWDEALAECTEAISRWPDDARPYRYRAVMRLATEDYDGAEEDYTSALRCKPEDYWRRFHRATPRWILGALADAEEDYEDFRAQNLMPSFADARLFVLLAEQGRNEEAWNLLDAARQRSADQEWLSRVFDCLAKDSTAAALIQEALSRGGKRSMCEACYYAAERSLLDGDDRLAQRYYARCVDTMLTFDPDSFHLQAMNEYHLARWRLAQLADCAGHEPRQP